MTNAMTTHIMSPIKAYRLSQRLTLEQFGALFEKRYDKTTIHRWERNGVPGDVRTILEIEKVTKGRVPRTMLAPEMFDFSTMPVGGTQ